MCLALLYWFSLRQTSSTIAGRVLGYPMKILSIIAIGFMSVALGTGLYHAFETHPSVQSLRKQVNFKNPQMRKLVFDLEDSSDFQGVVIGVSGIIGLVIGLVVLLKTKALISIIALVGSLAALVIVLATKTHLFS